MKEDILEQVVEDYYNLLGYFTCHNIKFSPAKDDPDYKAQVNCVASDIDILAYNPTRTGFEKTLVISCKSWQGGFNPTSFLKQFTAADLNHLENAKIPEKRRKPAWKFFRELVIPKWSRALMQVVEARTQCRIFTYVVAATRVDGPKNAWEDYPTFKECLDGNPVKIVDFKFMHNELQRLIGTTPASSELGRLIQVMRAAEGKPKNRANETRAEVRKPSVDGTPITKSTPAPSP